MVRIPPQRNAAAWGNFDAGSCVRSNEPPAFLMLGTLPLPVTDALFQQTCYGDTTAKNLVRCYQQRGAAIQRAAVDLPCCCRLAGNRREGPLLPFPCPKHVMLRRSSPAALPRCGDSILPSHPSLSTAPLCITLPKRTTAEISE